VDEAEVVSAARGTVGCARLGSVRGGGLFIVYRLRSASCCFWSAPRRNQGPGQSSSSIVFHGVSNVDVVGSRRLRSSDSRFSYRFDHSE
jgi:hypothetical protein